MLLDFHEHFIKQKFQETEKFYVGKEKCLVRATEMESLIPEKLTRLFYSKEVTEPSPDRKVTKRLIFNYLFPSV